MSTQHELKTWPEFFEAILDNRKMFELRKNDRNFKVGDTLRLREYQPAAAGEGTYTNRELDVRVTYILAAGDWPMAVQKGYVILGIAKLPLQIGPTDV